MDHSQSSLSPGETRRTAHRGRAATLLSKIITSEWFDIQRLARELVVPERTVALYMTGELEMPLERQACLARFLIAHVPPLARTSRNLLGQIQAAAAFATSDTETHSSTPGPTTRSF